MLAQRRYLNCVTYNPTPHRMTIDGVQMWAWCAMDTLIFAHILDKPAASSRPPPAPVRSCD
jgi:hypothetical protein